MYSYNRIHNDYDTNVVRVELNSSYRPHTINNNSNTSNRRAASRNPIKITSSSPIIVNRSDTFTKHERPSPNRHTNGGIIRSETFIVKHHNDSSDEQYQKNHDEDEEVYRKPDYSTYTRSRKKSTNDVTSEGNKCDSGAKLKYSTYTRSRSKEKRGSREDEQLLYINTDAYRKLDKKRASLLSQESENLNVNTFTKSTKPKRVESFIRKIEKNLWRRKDPKEPSPVPSSHSTDKSDRGESTMKRSKNIFNLITNGGGNKKSTREVEIQCKMDDEKDYTSGIITFNANHSNKKYRSLKQSQRFENEPNQNLSSIKKAPSTVNRIKKQDCKYDNTNVNKKSSTPAPIRVEIGLQNASNSHGSNNEKYADTNKKPIGIASPLPQTRSALKSGTMKCYDYKKSEIARYNAPQQQQQQQQRLKLDGNFRREENDQMSFREYRDRLRTKNENRRITDTSDDDLKRSYQQSFFIPM